MKKKEQYVEIKKINWEMILLYPLVVFIGIIVALLDLIIAFIPMVNIARSQKTTFENYFDWDTIKYSKEYEVKTK